MKKNIIEYECGFFFTWTRYLTYGVLCLLIGFALALDSCIPKVPEQTIEVVNACYMPEPFVKPKLVTVKYVNVFEYKCFVDSEQEDNARKREILLIEYANNITDLYNDAKRRCSENARN